MALSVSIMMVDRLGDGAGAETCMQYNNSEAMIISP